MYTYSVGKKRGSEGEREEGEREGEKEARRMEEKQRGASVNTV